MGPRWKNKDLLQYGFKNPLYPDALSVDGKDLHLRGTKMVEFEVKQHVELKDGAYKGVISKIIYKEQPYAYTDIYIKEDKTELEICYGCPSDISIKTKLGALLAQFTDIVVGDALDPEKVLIGKKVEFMVQNTKTPKGEFVNVVSNSVKPIK